MSTRRPPGAGSVTRTPHGTWRVRVPDATGKRRCVGTYADEAEARATLRAALERLAAAVCGAQTRAQETGT